MSADPTSPTTPEPTPTPAEPTPAETLPQKRRHKKPDATAPGGGDDPDSEIIILSSLLQNLLSRKQGAEPATEPEPRTKRFVSRTGISPAPTSPPASAPTPTTSAPEPTDATAADPAAPRPDIGGPDAMAAIAFPKFEPRAYAAGGPASWGRTGSTWGRGILYFAFTAALALGAFLVGRGDTHRGAAEAAKPSDASLSPAVWTPEATAQLDKAFVADHAGDLKTALTLTEDLGKSLKDSPFLEAYLATVNTRLGHVNDVEANLSRKLGSSTPLAIAIPLNEAQAFNYARRREFDRASDCFAEIAKVQPFDTTNLQRWGESLRRKGRINDAIGKFQQAITRLPDTLLDASKRREYLAFKTRLCQVEVGREAEFKAEMDQQLASPTSSGYWVLTTAAIALQKGDMPAAVDAMKKARALLPPADFDALVGDYYFRGFIYHAEMNPFLPPTSPERTSKLRARMDYFIDP